MRVFLLSSPVFLIGNMKVLLVDDNEELREFLAQCLAESSIEFEVAADGQRALSLAESGKFDAYLIDSLLGENDGLSLIAQLRASKNGQKVPILVMSNLGTGLARRMAKEVGCDEFLVKPFGPGQFIEQVRALEKIKR